MEDEDDLYDLYDDEPCDHEDRDVDILTGRASCWQCGESWWLTDEQLRRELELNAQMFEDPPQDDCAAQPQEDNEEDADSIPF